MKALKKLSLYVVFSLFMVFTVRTWLNGFEKPPEPKNIMETLVTLDNKTTEEVNEVLGKPKSIHREKVYTYKGINGEYDILIDEKVKNIVIKLNDNVEMTEKQILAELGIKEDIENKNTTNKDGVKKIDIYNISVFSKIEMNTRGISDAIDTIKITY